MKPFPVESFFFLYQLAFLQNTLEIGIITAQVHLLRPCVVAKADYLNFLAILTTLS